MLIAWSQGQGSGAAVPVTAGASKKQQIFDAVAARFATVLIANGYSTNIGQNVFEWKPEPWTPTEAPGVDVRDEDIDDVLTVGLETHKLRIHGRCVVKGSGSGSTIPSATADDRRKVQADVVTMVGVDATWGGLAEDTGLITARIAQIQQAEYVFNAIDVTFEIEYTTGIHANS